MQLDLPRRVAQIEEAGLAVAAPANQPAGDSVARLGLDPRRQALVRRPHLTDLLTVGELGWKRIDPRLPQPLQLLPPIAENVRQLGLFSPIH